MTQHLPSLFSLSLLFVTCRQGVQRSDDPIELPSIKASASAYGASPFRSVVEPPTALSSTSWSPQLCKAQLWRHTCTRSYNTIKTCPVGHWSPLQHSDLSRFEHTTAIYSQKIRPPQTLIRCLRDYNDYQNLDNQIAVSKRHGRQRTAYKRRKHYNSNA